MRLAFYLTLLTLGFVAVLTEVGDFSYWRIGVWRDFYQVESSFISSLEGIFTRKYTQVFALGTDNTKFTRSNGSIDAGTVLLIEIWLWFVQMSRA